MAKQERPTRPVPTEGLERAGFIVSAMTPASFSYRCLICGVCVDDSPGSPLWTKVHSEWHRKRHERP